MIIEKKEGWNFVKVNGRYAAITVDENNKLNKTLKNYGTFKEVPDSELFTAFGLIETEKGRYIIGNSTGLLRINELEFFLFTSY